MATMNPVDLYHDPSLDGLVEEAEHPRRNGSTNKSSEYANRRATSDGYTATANGRLPAAPEVPRGPPVSYRSASGGTDSRPQRSFSQRAKGRPFADEAFAEDEYSNENYDKRSQHRESKPRSTETQDQLSSGATRSRSLPQDDHVGRSNKVAQPATMHDAVTVQIPQSQAAQRSETVPKSLPNRAASLKDAVSQTDTHHGEWAPDRSPLQKLEVKLTDISKEEKRARVQEAEIKLLKDQKAGRASESSRRTTSQRANLSGQKLDPSARYDESSQKRSPRTQDRDSTRPVVPRDVAVQSSRPDEQRTVDKRSSREAQPRNPPQQSNVVSPKVRSTPRSPSVRDPGFDEPTRSFSARQAQQGQPVVRAIEPQVARTTSLPQPRTQARTRQQERPVSERERNASHQAALDQLVGRSPSATSQQVVQTPQRRSSKQSGAPVQTMQPSTRTPKMESINMSSAADSNTVAHDTTQHEAAQQSDIQQPQLKSQLSPPNGQQRVGLGLQNPSALRSTDSPPINITDVNKQRQRKSSVSFKEPFDRRRPGDEWKQASTARLVSEDFSTEQPASPEENKAWWEQNKSKQQRDPRRTTGSSMPVGPPIDDHTAQYSPRLHVKCGPLLRYTGLRRPAADAASGTTRQEFWRGSVMIVTQDSECSYDDTPTLRLFSQPKKLLPPPPAQVTEDHLAPEYIDPIAGLTKLGRTGKALYVRPVDHLDEEKDLSLLENDSGIYETSPSPLDANGNKNVTTAANNNRILQSDGERLGRFKEVKAVRIYADPDRDVTFWRFDIEVELGAAQQHVAYRINKGASVGFWVPARGQTMNMMFHSCNGFSLSTDTNSYSGPDPLWRDVLNNHQTRPFHVMIGGGDQIYNDRVMVDTFHFAEWTKIKNPHHKHQAPFTNEMEHELESFYLERYCMWFSQGLFAMANASIPMINVWDDHDIVDGFGSYPHEFMKTPVFSGLGNVAYKYYMLFQHQSVDSMTEKDEPSWVLGHSPGPYIRARSRSLYLELGQSVAFLGIDCRTERTRNDVLSIDTLELILDRCRREMVEGTTKHLIVLLGIPIAYPRLVWLENVLTSRAMDPIKALSRAGLIKTKFLNKFDGGVEILDDLDDHWTASHHKDERNILIQELQDLAAEKSARVTILSGDVHLAAIGQFYSHPKLKVPKDRDHRYMPNIVSSAIVNGPPPEFMADVMNKRNKVHHLDKYTQEDMIPMFTHDVDMKKRNNVHLLPRRNWCSIREYNPGDTPPPSPPSSPSVQDDEHSLPPEDEEEWYLNNPPKRRMSLTKNDFNPRNLMRRLSSRNAVPPSAFPGSDPNRPQQPRATSFDGTSTRPAPYGQSPQLRASSAEQMSDLQSRRPGFHRRPTNLSEKAARKGNVPAIDADGNEFDINDHVNLQGGLDIVINCEINPKDPAGITTPYRLLVPGLWYDGSSDREKIPEPVVPNRRATVLSKFGIGKQRGHSAAANQGAGNWGQAMSDTESYDGSDNNAKQKPQRSFSLFGSRRKKQKNQSYDYDDDQEQAQQQPLSKSPSQPSSYPYEHAPMLDSHDSMTPPQVHDQQYLANQNAHTRGLRQQEQDSDSPSRYTPPIQTSQSQRQPAATQPTRRELSQRQNSRPFSYTIGSNDGPSSQSSTPTEQQHSNAYQHPYDADASYVDQHRPITPPSTQPRRALSKQERVLGIGSAADNYEHPQQTKLRGNGIIGKNVPPPSSGKSSNQHDQNQYQGSGNEQRGYSGIEAYKEPKNKRRWSLSIRDKARGLIGSVEGKRRTGDSGDFYSDDEEEEYWEGHNQGQQQQPNKY